MMRTADDFLNKDKCFKSVPDTIEDAIDVLSAHMRDSKASIDKSLGVYGFEFQRKIRNSWKLWSPDSALVNDAKRKYGVEHPDDVSGLISEWAFAKTAGIHFLPEKYCKECQDHWKMFQKDASLNLI